MSELKISTTQLRIPPKMKGFLIRKSAKEKTTVSDYIRNLIEVELKKENNDTSTDHQRAS